MKIRKATLNDANRISYLVQKNTEANPNDYTKIQLDTWRKYNSPTTIKKQIDSRDVFCAFEHNKLVGTIAIFNNEILGFYISFSKRGRGIGSKLFSFIEKETKRRSIKTLYLTATPSAVSFYKNKGFKKLKDTIVTINGVNYNEVDMKKDLIAISN